MKRTVGGKARKKAALTERRTNCWEFMKCGREISGERAEELGVCAAAAYPHADGVNGGINGGRICWAIVGTYSCYVGMSSLARKKILCYDCEFHKRVLSEEGMMESEAEEDKRE